MYFHSQEHSVHVCVCVHVYEWVCVKGDWGAGVSKRNSSLGLGSGIQSTPTQMFTYQAT